MKVRYASATFAVARPIFLQAGSSDDVNPPMSAHTALRDVRVLIVESAAPSGSLKGILEANGYSVATARNGPDVLGILEDTEPDLILLDSVPAHRDAWQLLHALRARCDAAVLSLIDPADVAMIEAGLRKGIDDFVAQPVDPAELELRVQLALLNAERRRLRSVPAERRSGEDRRKMPLGRRRNDRRKPLGPGNGLFLTVGPFTIDDSCKRVLVEGEERRIGPKEFNLLKLLAAVPGRVVSNEEIIAALWPEGGRATASDVQQYIHLLRGKVEKNPRKPRWIKTVKGFGYRLYLAEADAK